MGLLASNDKRKRANSYDSEKENQFIGDQLDRKAAAARASASQDRDMHVVGSDRSLGKGDAEVVSPITNIAAAVCSSPTYTKVAEKDDEEPCDLEVAALDKVRSLTNIAIHCNLLCQHKS